MQISGADLIMTRLAEEGADAVFLVPGAQIDPLCQRLSEFPSPQPIVASHELSAGFMADGYARASNRIGVCMGIGSCGAANMLPAVAVAAQDGSPVLFLTGNVPNHLQNRGAFQDGWPQGADDTHIFESLVRKSAIPESRTDLLEIFSDLLESATTPFGSPVHLSLPLDIQSEFANDARTVAVKPDHFVRRHRTQHHHRDEFRLKALTTALANSRRPCLLVGPRFCRPEAGTLLQEFAERYAIPVATTLSTKGLLAEDHPLSLGNFGFSGSRRSLETLYGDSSDLILALGADFNERDSCCWDPRLRTNNRVILRIDSKAVESENFRADIDLTGDCVSLIRDWTHDRKQLLVPLLDTACSRTDWLDELSEIPRTFSPEDDPQNCDDAVPLDQVVTSLRQATSPDTILAVDAGFQRIFAGHYWQTTQPGTFNSACSTAPIGWAICAAIGIQIARPRQPVVVLTGDGCMAAHGMELSTMVRYRLPIVVVVCNNGAHGSVSARLPDSEIPKLPIVDWVAFAKSLGADGIRVRGGESSDGVLQQKFHDAMTLSQKNQCPVVLDVPTPIAPSVPHPEIARSAIAELPCSLETAAA